MWTGISDGDTVIIGGMLEHVEYAGVHSGDAAMVLPPHTLSAEMLDTVREGNSQLSQGAWDYWSHERSVCDQG